METVKGHGGFARSIEKQLGLTLRLPVMEIPEKDPLATARGLLGGYDVNKAEWRPYAVVKLRTRPRNRLAAFYDRGRAAVIISDEDISLGAMGVTHYDILGYTPKSAKRILTNIALYVYDRKRK